MSFRWQMKQLHNIQQCTEFLSISEQTFLGRVVALLAGPWWMSPGVCMGSMAEEFKRIQSQRVKHDLRLLFSETKNER